jgi:opacity protein-like surface antigen
VNGIVGVTFQSESDLVLGGEIGGNVHPNLEIYGGVHLLRNVLPTDAQDSLDDLSDLLTATTGTLWDFEAEFRAVTVAGGVKYRVPTGTVVRPYVLAGAGVANVTFKIEEVDLGDVTEEILAELGEEDATLSKPYFELGGGVEFPAGKLFLDAGYRYGRVVDAGDLNISRVYFGVGARF